MCRVPLRLWQPVKIFSQVHCVTFWFFFVFYVILSEQTSPSLIDICYRLIEFPHIRCVWCEKRLTIHIFLFLLLIHLRAICTNTVQLSQIQLIGLHWTYPDGENLHRYCLKMDMLDLMVRLWHDECMSHQ